MRGERVKVSERESSYWEYVVSPKRKAKGTMKRMRDKSSENERNRDRDRGENKEACASMIYLPALCGRVLIRIY